MSESKHTPGPFDALCRELAEKMMANRTGHGGKRGLVERHLSITQIEAFARIVIEKSAAPDLLDACKWAFDLIDQWCAESDANAACLDTEECDRHRAAIAKAGGDHGAMSATDHHEAKEADSSDLLASCKELLSLIEEYGLLDHEGEVLIEQYPEDPPGAIRRARTAIAKNKDKSE